MVGQARFGFIQEVKCLLAWRISGQEVEQALGSKTIGEIADKAVR